MSTFRPLPYLLIQFVPHTGDRQLPIPKPTQESPFSRVFGRVSSLTLAYSLRPKPSSQWKLITTLIPHTAPWFLKPKTLLISLRVLLFLLPLFSSVPERSNLLSILFFHDKWEIFKPEYRVYSKPWLKKWAPRCLLEFRNDNQTCVEFYVTALRSERMMFVVFRQKSRMRAILMLQKSHRQ